MSEPTRQSREQKAYEDLIRSHQAPLREYLFMICPNQTAREDILQETNRVLLQKREDFRLGTNFGAWARRIAQMQFMSFLKQRKTKAWLSFDSELIQFLATSADGEQEDLAFRRKELLSVCMQELEENDRTLIKLKYEQQLSLREISKLTGRSEGGLKQTFMRIRRSLGVCVERKLAAG